VHAVPEDFVPASSLAPVPGSSYSVRLGKIGGKWAVRVYRGQQILTTEIIGELDPNIMVTVVQSAISLPSYSPYHIVRAVSPLIREAKSGYVPPAPVPEGLTEVAPRPATYSYSSAPQSAPTSTSQENLQQAEGSTIQSDNRQNSTLPTPRPPLKAAPPLEALRVEKPRIQKRLVLEPVKPEELVERTFSSLMSYLGLALTYIYNNYGEKSTARMWQYMEEVSELGQEKRKGESFEDFIKRRVEEDMILGIEHNVVEFYDDKFVSRIRNCGFKENVADLEKSFTRFQQDLPCLLCQSTWRGSSRGIGFQFQCNKQKDGCEIVVEKPEAKR
jgi:hypothetical protein